MKVKAEKEKADRDRNLDILLKQMDIDLEREKEKTRSKEKATEEAGRNERDKPETKYEWLRDIIAPDGHPLAGKVVAVPTIDGEIQWDKAVLDVAPRKPDEGEALYDETGQNNNPLGLNIKF